MTEKKQQSSRSLKRNVVIVAIVIIGIAFVLLLVQLLQPERSVASYCRKLWPIGKSCTGRDTKRRRNPRGILRTD